MDHPPPTMSMLLVLLLSYYCQQSQAKLRIPPDDILPVDGQEKRSTQPFPPISPMSLPKSPKFDSRANLFKTMFDYTRSMLFPNQSVCVPHSVSVGTGIPWVAHPVSPCDTCAVLKLSPKSFVDISTCHNITVPLLTQCCVPGITCNQVHLPSFNMSDVIVPAIFSWCLQQNGASPPMGSIPQTACQNVYSLDKDKSYHHMGPIVSSSDNSPEDCVTEENSWLSLLELNKFCRIAAPQGTYWLCGTTVWPELPAQFTGICTLVYMYPAMRPSLISVQSHLPQSSKRKEEDYSGCVPGLTCEQTFWSRILGTLLPSYGVMQALDQVRSLSHYVEQLASDTAFALGNVSLALSSQRLMILQNRVALDYILASQGGTCSIIGPECCSDVVDPKDNLNQLIGDMTHLREQISGLSADNSSWLGGFLGPFWRNIVEICEIAIISFLLLLLVLASCISLVKCMCRQLHDATNTKHYDMSYA